MGSAIIHSVSLVLKEVEMLLPESTDYISTFFHPIIMDTGTIKKVLNGFGFISVEGGEDVFFHSEDLVDVAFDSLNEGDTVQFKMGSGPKGPKAQEVSKV